MIKESETSIGQNVNKEKMNLPSFHVDIIRHSKSEYKNYELQRRSNPAEYLNYRNQVGDLSEDGEELAQKSAEEFAKSINPEKEIVVLITSREARAYNTAKIYLGVFDQNNIEVWNGIPSHQQIYPVDFIDENEIDSRIVAARIPSLNYRNQASLDKLERHRTSLDIDDPRLSEKQRKDYLSARKVVESQESDHSWGENYQTFQGSAPEFGDIPTAKQNKLKILNGLEIIRRVSNSERTKSIEREQKKQFRYVVITHEENMFDIKSVDKSLTDQDTIPNCGVLSFDMPSDKEDFDKKLDLMNQK